MGVLAVVIILSRPKGVVLQALLGLFVFVVFLGLHAATFPYTNDNVDALETCSMSTVLASVWLGILMSSARLSSAEKQVPSVLIIGVNALFTVMAVGFLIKARREH